MIKKILTFAAVIAMCFCALSEGIPFAGTGLDKDTLISRYGAVADENMDFVAMSPKARAIETLFYGKIQTYAAQGMLMFNVQVEGNYETGVSYPVLRIVYAGNQYLKANTVMFNAGGEVYSVSVQSTESNAGRYRVETMKAYLSEEGFALVKSLANAKSAAVTILGDEQYTQSASVSQYYGNPKLEISAECLSALSLPEGTPDFLHYDLKALSEKAFYAKYGKETKITKVDASAECAYTLDKTFFLAADNAPGATIEGVQKLLKKNGFLAGSTGTQMNDAMVSAVKAAQGYYGLDVTGYADAALINALTENKPVSSEAENRTETAYECVSAQIAFNVNAWWLAECVETTMPGGGVRVSDKDNLFVVFDGEIASHALKSLSLSWEVKAELVKDQKYCFPCSVYTETQAGSALSTTLGMLRAGRLLVVCEIPNTLGDMEGEWTLVVSEGQNEFELKLAK